MLTMDRLHSISPVASEEKTFENVHNGRMTDAYLYYKLTNEPSAQES